nr:hypothetical protein [Tanacetum cinerariifolium]
MEVTITAFMEMESRLRVKNYPDVHTPSQEISNEAFHAKEDLMKSIQTFLEEFNCIPFEEKATILLQAWFRFFAIKRAQPENSNELLQKLLEDLKELVEYKESLKNSSKEIVVLNSNPKKEEPPQNSDIRHLIREECCVEASEEQKQNMDDTILELEVKNVVEKPAERRTRIEISLQNFRVIHKNSISLNNTSQISPIHAFAPILSTKEPEYSSSMGYENPNTTPETESDEIIKSCVEELVPILKFETFSDHTKETRSGNTTTHANDSLSKYDSFCFKIKPDQERLINVLKNDISDNSTSDPLLEEADLFLAFDNSIPPGIENFVDDSEGDVCFLEELLINDSIPFFNYESSDSNFVDNPSVPLPPPEPQMLTTMQEKRFQS